MLPLILVALACGAAALILYMKFEKAGEAALPLALLRAAAWGATAALLINPSCDRATRAAPTVLLDESLSLTDPDGNSRWLAALDSARSAAGESGRILLFGEEPRPFTEGMLPTARRSHLLPALREAVAGGGPVVVVTDGELDDAAAIPSDLLARARIVVLPRPRGPDVGVSHLDVPAMLRAGDTVAAVIEIVARAVRHGDSVAVELLEEGRSVARSRAPVDAGMVRLDLPFVPAPVATERVVRRYVARVRGLPGDVEPRDDQRETAAVVVRGSTIVVASDSPDWDFKWLVETLRSTAGVPVRGFVRLGGPVTVWRDSRTLRPVSDAAVREDLSRASLAAVHGTESWTAEGQRLSRRALLLWPAAARREIPGDWYVGRPDFASPVGGALAAVAAESLPPLESVVETAPDSVTWTGLTAQLERRGRYHPVMVGFEQGSRRTIVFGATGLWRWASRGGVAAEAYRSLVAAAAEWLLEGESPVAASVLAVRDSLAEATREFLPRAVVLESQSGQTFAGAGARVPLRHFQWLYFFALAALIAEWIARRRRGLR